MEYNMVIEMVVESHTQNIEGTASYFEQRATNQEEEKTYYFNQPVVMFDVADKSVANKSVVQDIISNMRTSIKECGIGLAHNQYPRQDGLTNPYAIFIIESKSDSRYGEIPEVPFEAFINPLIVGYSKNKVGFYHGCLSAIGFGFAKVSTYKEVLIAFISEDLELQVKKYEGMAAIICQHEFNHLTTRGTYVDTVNRDINCDRFINADGYYLGREEIKEPRGIIEPIEENVPCLTSDEVLAKCKKFLISNELYNDAVKKYLHDHPEDKFLYDNLMIFSYETDAVLYSSIKAVYALPHRK